MATPVTAVVLAGSRPGADPLLSGTGVSTKALLPVGGRPMLRHPLAALSASPSIGRIVVYGDDRDGLGVAIGALEGAELVPGQRTIALTVEHALRSLGGPLLVTTADHVLLNPDMVEDFLCAVGGADLAVGMVERRVVRRAGYSTRRTWLTFRGGQWSGANLFWLGGTECLPAIRFWAALEQERKKGRKVIAAFGPVTALLAALRLASIQTLMKRAGARFGIEARVVAMPQAEACIDADKPEDIVLIERILAARAR